MISSARSDDSSALAVHLGPHCRVEIESSIIESGSRLAPLAEADAVVWLDSRPESLPALPSRIRWVQLPGAGVEQWLERAAGTPSVTFTSAQGVYAGPVAEHALALLLAGVRRIVAAARTTEWRPAPNDTLEGAIVAVIGAGAIGQAVIERLHLFGARALAVTRRGLAVEGALESLAAEDVDQVWARADHFVLAVPDTPATHHLVGRRQLAAMKPHSWIVNVGRGPAIDTDALVDALRREQLGGAALDVTDPEPLPDGHPLWSEPRAVITHHVGPAHRVVHRHLGRRVGQNLDRLRDGRPLLYPIDLRLGY